ncbi:MAG TPA: FAD-binding protein, partial [Ktedonobacteraceae bacterium]|nr:FAD-binding protein [Ktedonobacteraceae bacterium]
HPTVLAVNGGSHLISEAVRGEGAYLRNHAGERFMPRYHELAELAPRDVVARSILSEMLAEGTDCQYLDLRHLDAERMHERFPTISALCHEYGLDLARDLLPVAPAAHYYMGGVLTDAYGYTTQQGLYAVVRWPVQVCIARIGWAAIRYWRVWFLVCVWPMGWPSRKTVRLCPLVEWPVICSTTILVLMLTCCARSPTRDRFPRRVARCAS